MKQVVIRRGKAALERVPDFCGVADGEVLIRVEASCISAGTETSAVKASSASVAERVGGNPSLLAAGMRSLFDNGVAETLRKTEYLLEAGAFTGYSISGTVVAVGSGCDRFSVGDRVAAAGAGKATHSQFASIPKNLTMKLPDGVSFHEGCVATLGGIAMQGVRRAGLTLGETALVVGCGILGLLTIQMLTASGVRCCACDILPSRTALAKEFGAESVFDSANGIDLSAIDDFTGKKGVDSVLFTAASSDDTLTSQCFGSIRKKGTFILVGVCGMSLAREDIYQKEIDFRISTSYGPGRYDSSYEQNGMDYPFPYVRWTENRNMEEFLRLVSVGKVDVQRMIDRVFPAEQAEDAFKAVTGPDRPLLVVIDYGLEPVEPDRIIETRTRHLEKTKKTDGPIRIAVVGAGGFATGMHLPNMEKMRDVFHLSGIVSRTPHKATETAKRFGADWASCDYMEVLQRDDLDAVLICTPHGTHGRMALQAMEAGKHVYVEKPLATTAEDLAALAAFHADPNRSNRPILHVGHNRRHSLYAEKMREILCLRKGPLLGRYLMNAGHYPPEHWVHADGGRIVGEMCHCIDLAMFLTGSRIDSASFDSLSNFPAGAFTSADNKSLTLGFEDGSVFLIQYLSIGSSAFPKETIDVHFDGRTLALSDFKKLADGEKTLLATETSQKGQDLALRKFADAIRTGTPPVPFEDLEIISKITLAS